MPSPRRYLTQSSMRAARACMRRYLHRYEHGYETVQRAHALEFGTWIHACLEAYWRTRQVRGRDPLGAALAALPADADPYDLARLRVMLQAYHAVWARTRCRVLAVEAKFAHPLVDPVTGVPSDFWVRTGKIDLILEASDDRIVLIEHKSSSEEFGPGTNYNQKLALSSQLSYYMAGAASLGYKPDQILYDVLRKPDEKPLQATPPDKVHWVTDKKTKEQRLQKGQRLADETPEEYESRLAAAIMKSPDDHVGRYPVYRLGDELDRFEASVWSQAELLRFALERGHFPQNDDACFLYRRRCEYFGVCTGAERLDDASKFTKLDDVHPELGNTPADLERIRAT